ncbi:hypothetical protein cce_1705 [Crocosphaera subtropica ATCC 51142]|uniref:Uncharacterized protein n=1 Tax=Crocosphaera subtropica (strain ATCC 51142 / BH68) TaxID=43989 RepID=B1WYN8_CROS5|nr:hypothetical protein [Crocosphaera subtropica]ACB51055.1 hypothetical protein cce_1705 [Crocosphaera subtropica ATCC 51142]
MIKAIKQKGIVNKDGKIEVQSPELQEGTEVEVIILVTSSETDTTEYLLSTEANKRELLEAIERVEKQEELITIKPEEWHEKYSI